MRKAEKRGLSGFFKKRGESGTIVFGCGYSTVERLIARGYIVSVDPDPSAILPSSKIIAEGETAWLGIADREGIDF
jgi:hypothetical protein